MNTISPDGEAAPADPCDLEAIISQVYGNIDKSDGWSESIFTLIAEVEALRARVTEQAKLTKELKTVCRNVINSKEAQQALGIGSITALKNALDALGK